MSVKTMPRDRNKYNFIVRLKGPSKEDFTRIWLGRSMAILPLPLIQEGVVSCKTKYVIEVLVNRLVKLAPEKKVWLGELAVPT